MSWPRDPFVSDGGYTTPLPQQPSESALWRAVTSLYPYASIAALMKATGDAAGVPPRSDDFSTPLSPIGPGEMPVSLVAASASFAAASLTEAKSATMGANRPGSHTASPSENSIAPTHSTSRMGVLERRSAFIAAAAASSWRSSTSSSFTASNVSPSSTAPTVGGTQPPGSSPSQLSTPATTALLPRAYSHSGWAEGAGLSFAGTTGYIRSACCFVLEPLQLLLNKLAQEGTRIGAGVVDVAVQHPLPCLRLELVRLLLTFKDWNWHMCAPIAVAAGVGDLDVLSLLLSVEELEPNLGFPLTVAVRHRQHEHVLPCLLSHRRIRPNYGGPFHVAVVTGNVDAMYMLGSAAGVNVNRYANNEGTSTLVYALRRYIDCSAQTAVQSVVPALSHLASPSVPRSSAPRYQVSQKESCGRDSVVQPLSPGLEETKASAVPSALASHRTHAADLPCKPDVHSGLCVVATDAGEGAGGGVAMSNEEALTVTAATTSETCPPCEPRSTPLFCSAVTAEDVRSSSSGSEPLPELTEAYPQELPNVRSIAWVQGTRSSSSSSSPSTWHSAQHWRTVLLYILNHPSIEVNSGFYHTPLQIAVAAGNTEAVEWLLQHPYLRPNHVPKSASVLCGAYYLLQRHTLSKAALQCAVAVPVDMALQLRHLELFRLLVKDQRVELPSALTMGLERHAGDINAVPYLTILAQYRAEWEGWGWRWRRRCIGIAAVSNCVIALCCWLVWGLWWDTLAACAVVFLAAYGVQLVLGLVFFAWEACLLPPRPSWSEATATEALEGHAPVLTALVRYVLPSWSGAWHYAAVALLLLCPGMVPLPDILSGWCMYSVKRSRRLLRIADGVAGAGGRGSPLTESRLPGSAHGESIRPDADGEGRGAAAAAALRLSPQRADHLQRRDVRSPSVNGRTGGHVIASATTAGHDSFADAAYGSSSANESFSRPRPSAARMRRQVLAADAHRRRRRLAGGAFPSAVVSSCGAGAATTSDGATFSRSTSAIIPTSSTAASPTTRSFPELWVVPGRASLFSIAKKFRAPDLTLRALAYRTYDQLLLAPRLLMSVVGIFMFMYMVFPSSSSSSSAIDAALADYGTMWSGSATLPAAQASSCCTEQHHSSAGTPGCPYGAVSSQGKKHLNGEFTLMMNLVGLCGLVASIVGGGALLAMAVSLRIITTQSCFARPHDRVKREGNTGQHHRDGGALQCTG